MSELADPNYPISVLVNRCVFKVGDRVKRADGSSGVLKVEAVDFKETARPVFRPNHTQTTLRSWSWRLTVSAPSGIKSYGGEHDFVADVEAES